MGILLCILTSIGWSTSDIFRKGLTGRLPTEQLSLWVVLAQLPLFSIWAGLDVWLGQQNHFSSMYILYALGSGLLNALTVLGMLWSFRLAPISLTIPLLSLTPLVSAVFDMVFSAEFLRPIQWVGLVVITLGATALGLGKHGWFREKGAWIMIGVAIAFSLLFSIDRVATSMVGSSIHACISLYLTALFLVLFFVLRRRWISFHRPQFGWFNIWGSAFAMTCAYGIQLYAFEIGTPIAVVEVYKRSIGIIVSMYFGYKFFHEPISREKLLSAPVMSIGIAVLLLA